MTMSSEPIRKRCDWVDLKNPRYVAYHDNEWGVPVHDDRKHFEMLVLEGAQAGLSWATILNRREGYREAFDNFDPKIIAGYSEEKLLELQQNPAIIRNRLKIRSAVTNARVFLKIQEEFGDFDRYIWRFVDGIPLINHYRSLEDVPASTPLSTLISKELRKQGMTFVGPTILYAYMQAVGVVNDHLTSCFRYDRGMEGN